MADVQAPGPEEVPMAGGRAPYAAVAAVLLLVACGPQAGSVSELSGPSPPAAGSADATTESNPAATPDPGLPPSVPAVRIHKQDLVDDVVEQMWKSPDTSGYARSTVDVDALTVQIMWKGEPPADVKRLAGTTPDGVRVLIVGVPYNEQEIAAAGRRVFEAGMKGEIPVRPVAAYANEAFDGLVVEISSADYARSDLAALADQLAAIAHMPVTIQQGAVCGAALSSSCSAL
jgi:hypothetical protein